MKTHEFIKFVCEGVMWGGEPCLSEYFNKEEVDKCEECGRDVCKDCAPIGVCWVCMEKEINNPRDLTFPPNIR